jgi:hypothetical protein
MSNLPPHTSQQFMRIALAVLKPRFPFYPQRLALAARMLKTFTEKKVQNSKKVGV